MKKPETKATETYFDEKDFNITASSKVIIPTKYKQNKQAKSTATTKTSVSTSQPSTSKTMKMKNQELDLKPGQVIGTIANHLKQDKKKNQLSSLQEYKTNP